MTKVLVTVTSHRARGGVPSVVKAYEQGQQWRLSENSAVAFF